MIDDDEVLIKGLKRGNKSAQERFYQQYRNKVYGTCLHILKNAEDAEDATSLTLFTVMHKINKFKGDSKLNSWVYRIAFNQSLMILRQVKRHSKTILLDDSHEAKEVREMMSNYVEADPLLRDKLIESFKAVPKLYRNVIFLRLLQDLENKEVAALVEQSLPAVKSQYHRGVLWLRKMAA